MTSAIGWSLLNGPPSNFGTASGATLHYQEVGSGGTPVIFLHGGGPGASSWSNFSGNADAFSEHHRSVFVDLPGYGLSGPAQLSEDESAFEYYERVVYGLMDEMGITRAHIVGNSLGGGVAYRLALRRPEAVASMVLMGPAGACFPVFSPSGAMHRNSTRFGAALAEEPNASDMRGFLGEMLYDSSSITDEMIEARLELLRASMSNGVTSPILNMWKNAQNGVAKFDARDFEGWLDCASLTTPTLLIWGRDDKVNPLDGSLYPLRYMPHVELHVFGRCGHWAQVEQRHRFDEVALAFFEEHET
jgi:4,5:9,10-diseco-3-hydroxy-5,9,17-trioxoandrosta-1(10),2-diene-4-oate hydrolase